MTWNLNVYLIKIRFDVLLYCIIHLQASSGQPLVAKTKIEIIKESAIIENLMKYSQMKCSSIEVLMLDLTIFDQQCTLI